MSQGCVFFLKGNWTFSLSKKTLLIQKNFINCDYMMGEWNDRF